MQPALASFPPGWLAFGSRAMACVVALLFVVAPRAAAQMPTGAQPIVGVTPPVSIPTYAVQVAAITVSPNGAPIVGQPMMMQMILQDWLNSVASGVPYPISLSTYPLDGSRTVLAQGTLPPFRYLDTVTVYRVPSAVAFLVHGTVAPNGPVSANQMPASHQALDVSGFASPIASSSPVPAALRRGGRPPCPR